MGRTIKSSLPSSMILQIWRYCSNLLKHTVEGSRLGSKDEAVVMELLTVGHPEYTRKMLLTSSGTGGAAPEQIQVSSMCDFT